MFISGIIVYITIFAIPIELILYKLKKIKRQPILIPIKFQIIIWFIVLLSWIISPRLKENIKFRFSQANRFLKNIIKKIK